MPRDWDATTYERLSAPMTAMGTDVLDRLDPPRRRDGARRGLRHRRRHAPAARAAARGAGDRGRRRALDGRAGARAAARRRRRPPGRPARAGAGASRSTPSCPPRRSTGSSTTSGCSRGSTRRCGRAGGSSRSAAATGTSPRSSRPGSTLARETPFAEHFGDWTTDWRVRDARGHRAPPARGRASPTSGAGSAGSTSTRAIRRRTCARSASARSWTRLPEDLHEPFVAAALDRLPDPLVIHYVRLNILARA